MGGARLNSPFARGGHDSSAFRGDLDAYTPTPALRFRSNSPNHGNEFPFAATRLTYFRSRRAFKCPRATHFRSHPAFECSPATPFCSRPTFESTPPIHFCSPRAFKCSKPTPFCSRSAFESPHTAFEINVESADRRRPAGCLWRRPAATPGGRRNAHTSADRRRPLWRHETASLGAVVHFLNHRPNSLSMRASST